ncbi:MAG: hypothetical protein WCQ23_05590 [Candidatus Methanomethylophilaceae archaeon]
MRFDTASVGKLFGKDTLPEGLSLMRQSDKLTAIVAAVSALVALGVIIWQLIDGHPVHEVFPYVTIPLVACGALFFLRRKYWVLVIIAVLLAAMYLLGVSELIFYLGFLVALGVPGSISIASIISRWVFYRALHAVECVSMPKKARLKERALAFIFDLPKGLDTRDLMSNWKMRRSGIPWKDVLGNVTLALMVGIILWICITLDRGSLSDLPADTAVLYILSIIAFIPLFVLPLILFRSLDVRITADNCDVPLFGGIMSTMVRTFLPLAVVLLIALATVGSSDILWVLAGVLISAVMIAAVMLYSSVLYYGLSEPSLINDVNQKWRSFHPVSMMSTVNENEGSRLKDVPGTPVRDRSEYGTLTLPKDGHSKS